MVPYPCPVFFCFFSDVAASRRALGPTGCDCGFVGAGAKALFLFFPFEGLPVVEVLVRLVLLGYYYCTTNVLLVYY